MQPTYCGDGAPERTGPLFCPQLRSLLLMPKWATPMSLSRSLDAQRAAAASRRVAGFKTS